MNGLFDDYPVFIQSGWDLSVGNDGVTLSAAFSDELDNRRTERLASQLTLTIVTVDVGWRGLGACVTDTTLYLRGDILARRKRRASLPQRGTRSSGSVSRLALPASMGVYAIVRLTRA